MAINSRAMKMTRRYIAIDWNHIVMPFKQAVTNFRPTRYIAIDWSQPVILPSIFISVQILPVALRDPLMFFVKLII